MFSPPEPLVPLLGLFGWTWPGRKFWEGEKVVFWSLAFEHFILQFDLVGVWANIFLWQRVGKRTREFVYLYYDRESPLARAGLGPTSWFIYYPQTISSNVVWKFGSLYFCYFYANISPWFFADSGASLRTNLNPSVLPCQTSTTRPLPSQGHTALLFSSGALGKMSGRGVCCTMLKYVTVGGRGGAEFHNKQLALERYRNGMQIAAVGLFLPLVTFRSYFYLATDVYAIHQAAKRIFPALGKSFACIFFSQGETFFLWSATPSSPSLHESTKTTNGRFGRKSEWLQICSTREFFNH